MAAWSDNEECIKILLSDKLVDPNPIDTLGCTPLHNAAINNSLKSIKILLLDKRINKNNNNFKGKKAIDTIGIYSINKLISNEIEKLLK